MFGANYPPLAVGSKIPLSTSGSVLFVDGSGNLGQDNGFFYYNASTRRLALGGTTSPNSPLDVRLGSNFSGGINSTLSIDRTGAENTKRFGFFVGDGTSGTKADENYIKNLNTDLHIMGGASGTTEVMTVTLGGKVGIGAPIPGFPLDVQAAGNLSVQVLSTSANGYAEWRVIPNGSGVAYITYGTSAGNTLQFFSSKAGNVMSIDGDGNVQATALLDLSPAGAGQIKFPATQHASANANTLDDYAEGTWTPTLNGFTTVGAQTNSGRYTKIGRLVFVWFSIKAATSNQSFGGTSNVSGLPFAAAKDAAIDIANDSTLTPLAATYAAAVASGSAIYTPDFTVGANVAVICSGCYEV